MVCRLYNEPAVHRVGGQRRLHRREDRGRPRRRAHLGRVHEARRPTAAVLRHQPVHPARGRGHREHRQDQPPAQRRHLPRELQCCIPGWHRAHGNLRPPRRAPQPAAKNLWPRQERELASNNELSCTASWHLQNLSKMFYSFCAMKFTIRNTFTSLLALAGLLLLVPTSLAQNAAAQPAAKPTVAEALAFIDSAEKELAAIGITASRAQWVEETYITDDTD